MARIQMDITNFASAEAWVQRIGASIARIDAAEMHSGAKILLDEMKREAGKHRKTGALIKALKIKRTAKELRVGVVHGPDAPYAHLVEYGHGGPHPAPPHPFMRTAADAVEERVLDAIAGSILDGIGD